MKTTHYTPYWFAPYNGEGFGFKQSEKLKPGESPGPVIAVCFCQANYLTFDPYERSWAKHLATIPPCPIHSPTGHPARTFDRHVCQLHIKARDRASQSVYVPLVLRDDGYGHEEYDIDSLRILIALGLDLDGPNIVESWVPESLRPKPAPIVNATPAVEPALDVSVLERRLYGATTVTYTTNTTNAAAAPAPMAAPPAPPALDTTAPATIRVVKAKRSSLLAHQVDAADLTARLANVVPRV